MLAALWGADAWTSARAEASRRARLTELTDAIRSSLPTGSTPAQVVAFLDGRNIEHYFDGRTRSLYASTAEEQVNFLLRARVLVVFHFDEAVRMTTFSVEQGLTGP